MADFGLVKDLEGVSAQVSGAVTPIYAAPETFEGTASRSCDQYNLAIVYQELLTGQRPFNGTNVRQLLMQHVTGTPNLASLPVNDRAPIARALSKKPEDRFPTCMELVKALRGGQGSAAVRAMDWEPVSIETPPVARLSPTRVSERPPIAPASPAMTIPPVMGPSATVSKNVLAKAASERKPAFAAPPREEVTGDGVLFPALVIGLGGLGLQVLQQLRANLHERCGPPDFLPQLRLLYIDTDPEVVPGALEGPANSVLEEREVVLAQLNRPSHYLKAVRNRAILDTWLNLAMVCRLPRNQVTTEGLRILGRLGLVDNYRTVVSHLRTDLEACVNPKALSSAQRQTQRGIRTNRPRVYVVAGLGGGTGSGMFIDMAYMVRDQLRRLGYQDLDVVGLFLLPSAEVAAKKSPALGNAFAALTELNHFSSPEARYQAFFDDSEDPLHDSEAPFGRCIMLPLPPEERDPTATRTVTAFAGDFLCRELIGALGRKAEEARAELSDPGDGSEMVCQTFGSQRYTVPRRAMREQATNLLGIRLVQNWMSQDRLATQEAVAARLADPAAGINLRPEIMFAQLMLSCERSLQRPPEAHFQAILKRCFGQSGDVQAPALLGALGEVEQLVGRPTGDSVPTIMGEALAQAAQVLRREQVQRVGDFLAALVEEPQFRVGGAQEAYQQLVASIRESGQTQQARLRNLIARATDVHTHIHALVCNLQRGSWWPGRKSKTAAELRESMEEFPKLRYECLVLEQVLELYRGLLEDLPKKQEELTFARERLGQFLHLLREDLAPPSGGKVDLGPGRHFFPSGCRSFDEAIDALLRSVKPEELQEIDQKTQLVIRRQFRSLLQLCLGPGAAFKDLWTALQQQVGGLVDGLLGKANAAAIYLKDQPNESMVSHELAAAFDDAAPKLAGRRPNLQEIRLVVVPADLAGERLGQLSKAAVKGVEVLAIAGTEDVYFYREQPQLPLADLPQLGLLAEEAYRQMTASGFCTVHTRMDVTNWLQPG